MDAHQHLEGRFGLLFYRVPPESVDDFLACQRRAAAVFREGALSWTLWRSRKNPDEWVEFGPLFRERAALDRAAAVLKGKGILERLATFEVDRFSPIEGEEGGPIEAVSFVFTTKDYDVVFQVGAGLGASWFDRDLPPIEPADMSAPMRLAHSLASALSQRLDAAVPRPFRVSAEQECVYLLGECGLLSGGSIVDLGIEDAITRLLTDVQDEITEQLAVPWPHEPTLGYVFHEPGVAIRDDAVQFWYGAEDDPVLAFEPIPLAELDA
jgi:hypothetical protein